MIYTFGRYELNSELYELRCSGETIKLEPKAFDLLTYLIQQRHRVVSKGELRAQLWPRQFVTDDALVRCVMLARKAVQDSGTRQDVIKTLHRRGYQFVAPVKGYQGVAAAQNIPHVSLTPSPEAALSLHQRSNELFVGKPRELALLQACLDDALAGYGRLVLLVGEFGIGKSRTTEETTTYARQCQVQVLTGQCYKDEGTPAFWPWIQIVRAYLQCCEPVTLRQVIGPRATDIAIIVPSVQQYIPHLPPPRELEPKQARFRFCHSLTTCFKAAASLQPLLLILNDLHWADTSSMWLLQFLACEIGNSRILVVGTYRDMPLGRQHPLPRTLGALDHMDATQRLVLHG